MGRITFILLIMCYSLIGCDSTSKNNNSTIDSDTLIIENLNLEMDFRYSKNGVTIKDPLSADSMKLEILFKNKYSYLVDSNFIEVKPTVQYCNVTRDDNRHFNISFVKEKYSSPKLTLAIFLVPKYKSIFVASEKEYYKPHERIFLGEKQNNIVLE